MKLPMKWDMGLLRIRAGCDTKTISMRANFIVLAYAIEAVKRDKHSIVMPIKHKMTNIVGHQKGCSTGTHTFQLWVYMIELK